MGSGLKKYKQEILQINQETGKKSDSIAEILRAKYPEDKDTNWGNLGRAIRHHKILEGGDVSVSVKSKTSANDYSQKQEKTPFVLSAWKDGLMRDIDEYY